MLDCLTFEMWDDGRKANLKANGIIVKGFSCPDCKDGQVQIVKAK